MNRPVFAFADSRREATKLQTEYEQIEGELAAAEQNTGPDGTPYKPVNRTDELRAQQMLCKHCRLERLCPIKTRMARVRDGGRWPQGGWVHDAGGGVSCLTYRTKPIAELPVTTLRIIHSAPEEMLPKVCGGCATRRG